MHLFKLKKIFAIFIVLAVFGFTACATTPSEFAQADRESQQENVTTTTESPQASLKEIQKESSKRGASAVADNAVAGGKLNKFFPKPGNGYDVVYAQEKAGFAQAKWKKGGQELAAISISDVASNPAAADKFANSTSKIKGYPSASQGTKGTGVLVGRFQVKVLSRDASFSEGDREALLEKFDLAGLENLVKPIANTPPTRQTKQETKQEFKDIQKESSQRKAEAVAKDAIKGAAFNKFFPKPGNGYDVVFSQEKKGFAQAKLKKGGQEVALLSVSDISSTPASAQKYTGSQEKIQGYPVANKGTKGTGILVQDRLQVQVMSRDTSFSESDRKDWLKQFDLSGLAQLVK